MYIVERVMAQDVPVNSVYLFIQKSIENTSWRRNMWLGIVGIVASLGILLLTERCRRSPQACKNMFMQENGMTRSFVAFRFLGRPHEAREAIVKDPILRRQYLIESYVIATLGAIAGISLIIQAL